MPRGKDTKPLSIPLSIKGYESVQRAAASKQTTINDYVRDAIAAKMRGEGHEVTAEQLSPGQWGGNRYAAEQAKSAESGTVKQVIGFSTKRIAGLPSGATTGLLAPASRRDAYRPVGAREWQDVDDWEYGRAV